MAVNPSWEIIAYMVDQDIPGSSTRFCEEFLASGAQLQWFPRVERSLIEAALQWFETRNTLITEAIIFQTLQDRGLEQYIPRFQEILEEAKKKSILKASEFMHYLNLSEKGYLRSQMTQVAGGILNDLQNGYSEEIVSHLQLRLEEIEAHRRRNGQSISVSISADAVWKDYLARESNPAEFQGIPTGFREYDSQTGGMYPGELITVSSRTGIGKSIVLQHIAHQCWRAGYQVVFVSQEMEIWNENPNRTTLGPMMMRLYAMETGIPYDAIRLGKLMAGDREKLQEAVDRFRRAASDIIFIPPGKASTTSQIDAEIRSIVRDHPVDVIFVDYLQITRPRIRSESGSTTIDLGNVVRELKESAHKWKCPLVTASQLNREAVSKGANMGTENLAWSDEIGHTSSVVIGLARTETDRENGTLTLKVLKNRTGLELSFRIGFDPSRMQISNLGDRVFDLLEREEAEEKVEWP